GHVGEQLSVSDLRVVEHVAGTVHRARWHAGPLQSFGDLGLVPQSGPRREVLPVDRGGERNAGGLVANGYHTPLVVPGARVHAVGRHVVTNGGTQRAGRIGDIAAVEQCNRDLGLRDVNV